MAKAWLTRPYPHKKDRMREFLSNGIIACGWPGIGNLTGFSRADIKQRLTHPPYNYSSLELGNAYATIDIIVNQMQIGDYVLIPHNDDIYFAKVTSDYCYDPSKDSDIEGFCHQRRVSFMNGPIDRGQLPADLRKSLKVHRATADLSPHFDSIKAAAEGSEITELPEMISEFIQVQYPLRPDLVITLEIPNNITQIEASRLGDFIKTLYFEAD